MQGTGSHRYLAPLLAVALLLTITSSLQATLTNFFDNTWPTTTTWSDSVISPPSTAGTSVSMATPTTGGPTGGVYRQTTHTYFAGALIEVAHVAAIASYIPSTQGSISSVTFSFAANDFSASSKPGVTSINVAYALLIFQNNTYYSGPVHSVQTNAWSTFSDPGLTAANFTRLSGSGPSQPDFTCLGPLIQFGFITGNSDPTSPPDSTRPITTQSGIDNWSVTVDSETPCCSLTGNIVSGCCLGPVPGPPCPGSVIPSDFFSFLASVTLAGPASCTLTVSPNTIGLVVDSFGPTTLAAGANFVSGTFSAPQTGGNFSLSLSCTGPGGLVCSSTLTAPLPACQPASSGNPTSTVSIQKVVDTEFTSTTPFAISVDCGGTVTQVPLANGGSQTVTAAAGTSCTVSETLPTGTFKPPGCPAGAHWLPPTFVPSPTVVISTSLAKLLVVHNSFKCNAQR